MVTLCDASTQPYHSQCTHTAPSPLTNFNQVLAKADGYPHPRKSFTKHLWALCRDSSCTEKTQPLSTVMKRKATAYIHLLSKRTSSVSLTVRHCKVLKFISRKKIIPKVNAIVGEIFFVELIIGTGKASFCSQFFTPQWTDMLRCFLVGKRIEEMH